MSSNTPASFASAAAGQSRGARPGDGDWARRDGRSANGTLTFRRPSAVVINQQSQNAPDASTPALPSVLESPATRPNLPLFDGSLRYSREQLLDIYKGTPSTAIDVSNLFVGGWSTTQVNGATRGWGKSSEGTIPQDPTVCWDSNGSVAPIGLQEMTEEEKEVFADVNSTLKPQQPKDGGQIGGAGGIGSSNAAGAVNGRKTSISQGAGYGNSNNNTINNNNNTPSSISSSRPATRRRETSDTNPFPTGGLASPLSSRTPREESSWFGSRKLADAKDAQQQAQQTDEPEEEQTGATPGRPPNTATLGRSNTAGSVLGGSSSLWGTSGSAPAPAAGAFGSFALPSATGDKRFGSVRGESRLAHLLPKNDGADVIAPGTKPVGTSAAVASPVGPATGGVAGSKDSWRARPRTDTDPFGEDGGQAGEAAPRNLTSFDTPVKATKSDFGLSGLNIGSSLDEDPTGSPETNPFRSPPAERSGGGNGEGDHVPHAPAPNAGAIGGGAGLDHVSVFGSVRGGYPTTNFDGSDRSQTSSVGAKGFSSFGNIAGWGNPLTSGTPDRDRTVFSAAFGNSLFSPGTGELQSPAFGGGVPGSGVFGAPGASGTGSLRTSASKLGALFPASMQAQMSANQEQQEGGALSDSVPDLRQINPLGAIGREAVGSQVRDADLGSIRPGRGLFDDPMDSARGGPSNIFTTEPGSQANILASASSPLPQQFESGPRPNADTPLNAPRTMVMPDRMRWVYLDPQGQTQGPFTGLEMNDWYKANFFTADLRVRKVEDTEFEPLGQLIRRIGNSREPFLVPQIGVAHGQPSLSGTFAHGDRGTVIPPLVGAFPSYGRTLTAEEQNNLERRKQEEQYVLARQREMLAVQHHAPFSAARPGAVGVPGGALHHHSSAHSLQSQPSFGSITSPLATGPPPIPSHLGAASGFYDHSGISSTSQPLATASTEFLRDEFNLQDRQMLSSILPNLSAAGSFPPQQTSSGIASDMGPLGHLPSIDHLQKDPQGFSERLKEFKQYREQFDAGEAGNFQAETSVMPAPALGKQKAAAADIVDEVSSERQAQGGAALVSADDIAEPVASLSLTQQVQKTQAEAAAAKRRGAQADEPVEALQPDLPMPFPPPQGAASSTPLAAPTAQRTRSTLPDQYATSQSRSETPESGAAGATQPPPLAPWARDPGSESHRGPSLKEIQEAEAKKAAKAEEIATAARKIAAEQEAALQREREKAAAALAPGLPTSSTWGNGTPTAPGAAIAAAPASPWAKASNAKSNAVVAATGGAAHSLVDKKKTLADIQREEEARKQKTRELASQSPLASSPYAGKRYADLASRSQPPAAPSPTATSASPVAVAAGWATVGAGGKVKTPTAVPAARSVSAAVPAVKPPVAPVASRSVSRQLSGVSGKVEGGVAMDEFNKWLHREVSRGIADDIDVNMFVDTLLQLPPDQSIISEAVYGSSKTMDGRHFAEEFIRRKKLAERGIVEKQATEVKTGGGWSEVAKKGGNSVAQKEESMPAGFKVVPSRKKGKK
ncbi:kinesin-like protein [Sporothrix curviconia]|uniref:Kinesin-like protein n=1 Tax=Sporothrix curviconia TaxID=1260050 RepID=A0ABP0AY52_9PEZI